MANDDYKKCFSVDVIYNGTPLSFIQCLKNPHHHERCTYEKFMEMIKEVSYDGDYIEECKKPYKD